MSSVSHEKTAYSSLWVMVTVCVMPPDVMLTSAERTAFVRLSAVVGQQLQPVGCSCRRPVATGVKAYWHRLLGHGVDRLFLVGHYPHAAHLVFHATAKGKEEK